MAFLSTVHSSDRQRFFPLLCTNDKCSLDRIDCVCRAPVFGEKAANQTRPGTAQDDSCPAFTSCLKNPRHPGVALLYFIFWREAKSSEGIGWSIIMYHITEPDGTAGASQSNDCNKRS